MKMKLDYKKIWSEVITASLIIIISGIAIISFIIISNQSVDVYNPSSKIEVSKGSDKIEEILTLLQSKYIEKVDVDNLVNGAINGIFSKIDDPYTRYLTEEEYDEVVNSGNETYYGVGIHISINLKTNQLVIIGVMPESPAKKAGLKAGDIIIAVDGIKVTKKNYSETSDRIKGKENTKVKIQVKSSDKIKNYTMTRKEIVANNIESDILKDNIGYIKIFEFSSGIYDQFKAEYDKLVIDNKVSALVIDLRDNPGGQVTETVKIADMLLKKGVILETINGDGTKKTYMSNETQIQIPLAILVNANSASASEILAGSVQDLKQGTVIGSTTFGKGIVQSIIKLESGGGVSITTSKYYTASGKMIHGVGITPDIKVSLPKDTFLDLVVKTKKDLQLNKAIEILKKQM